MKPVEVDKLTQSDNPLRLKEFIAENDINTVIFDSLTSYSNLCLARGVEMVKSSSATILHPTMKGYGNRNGLVLQTVKKLLRVTAETGTHIIFIAHEDVPEKNDEGVVMHISIMLGGKMSVQAPVDLSEVWAVRDDGKKKRFIAVRPCRQRQPMKTRMFQTTGEPEFQWDFDPDHWKGDGQIAKWYDAWVDSEGKKIPIPKIGKSND